jgi:hypothetical protein
MKSAPRFLRRVSDLTTDTRAASAAEFALVLPLLMITLFTFVEAGRYIDHLHVVSKAVRDGVRYAARQPFAAFGCGGAGLSADVSDSIKRYVRTGSATGSTGRLPYWTSDATVSVSASCVTAGAGISGIYETQVGGAPVVRVSADVPYVPILGSLARLQSFSVGANAESAVMGL